MSELTRFKPGNPGGGRPKGSRNRLSEQFLTDFLKAWEAHGAAALAVVANDDPSTFVRVAAKLLPKHVEHRHSLLDELQALPLEKLQARLAELRRKRSALQQNTPQPH